MKTAAIFFSNNTGNLATFQKDMQAVEKEEFAIAVMPYEGIEISVHVGSHPVNAKCARRPLTDFSIAYFKKSQASIEIARPLALIFEAQGVPVYDKALMATPYADKLHQTVKMALADIPVPPTLYFSRDWVGEKYEYITESLQLPFIMKDLSSNRGECNFLIKNKEQFHRTLAENTEAEFIFQRFIPNQFDYRVYVTNHKIATLYTRTRQGADEHRNNGVLGGKVDFLTRGDLDERCQEICEKVTRLFELQIAGVDLVVATDGSGPYIFEVNNSPLTEAGPTAQALADFLYEAGK